MVRLQDSLGNFLAHAVSDGPRAAVPYRILSRERHPEFNAAFFEAAVETALRRRRAPDAGGYRPAPDPWRGRPSARVFCDRHGTALLLEIQSPGMQTQAAVIEEALWQQASPKSLWVKLNGAWERVRGEKCGPEIQSRVTG